MQRACVCWWQITSSSHSPASWTSSGRNWHSAASKACQTPPTREVLVNISRRSDQSGLSCSLFGSCLKINTLTKLPATISDRTWTDLTCWAFSCVCSRCWDQSSVHFWGSAGRVSHCRKHVFTLLRATLSHAACYQRRRWYLIICQTLKQWRGKTRWDFFISLKYKLRLSETERNYTGRKSLAGSENNQRQRLVSEEDLGDLQSWKRRTSLVCKEYWRYELMSSLPLNTNTTVKNRSFSLAV